MEMFDWLKGKPKSNLGIDLGTSAIKVVELSKKNERYILETYGIYPLKKYLSAAGDQFFDYASSSGSDFPALLKATLEASKTKTNTASLSFPVFSSFSVVIDMPDTIKKEELSSSIQFEARKYIPLPFDEIELDWSVIDNEEGRLRVLLIAVTKDILKKYSELSAETGIKVNSFEVESFSLVRSLIGNDKSAIVLVDIGAQNTNIVVVNKGIIKETHNFRIGGAEITRLVAKQLGVDVGEAEKIKKSHDGNLDQVYVSIADTLAKRIKVILDDYAKRYKKNVEKCILIGGVGIAKLRDVFSDRLKMEVVIGDCFAKVQYPEELKDTLKDLSPSLAVAVGLAMKDL